MTTRTPKAGLVTMPATTFAQMLLDAFERGRASTPTPAPQPSPDGEATYSQGVLDGMQIGCTHGAGQVSIDERFASYLAGRMDGYQDREES